LGKRRIAGIVNTSHEAAIIKLIDTLSYPIKMFMTMPEAYNYLLEYYKD